MNDENKKLIREAVKVAGDYLKTVLKPIQGRPVRNAYAHIWKMIKTTMGKPFVECSDSDVQQILDVIHTAIDNK